MTPSGNRTTYPAAEGAGMTPPRDRTRYPAAEGQS